MEAIKPANSEDHGADSGALGRLACFTVRHRWLVIGVWIVLTLFGPARYARQFQSAPRHTRPDAAP